MKFILDISGTKLLLNADQLQAITTALYGSEKLESKYMGKNKVTGNTDYLPLIVPYDMRECFRTTVMCTDEYDAMVLVTKLQAESSV
jgi:hypothetical protein